MVDYKNIERAKEVILESYDDSSRTDPKVVKSIFDNFKFIVDEENKQWDYNYLNNLRNLKGERAEKQLKKEISDKEAMLFNAFWTINTKEISDQDFLSKTSWYNVRKRKFLNNKYQKKNYNKKDINDQLYSIFKRLYNKNIVFHWEKQRNGWIKPKADIDGQASMLLLKLCGFFKDDNGDSIRPNINFVENGKWLSKWLHLDTNQTIDWLKVEKKHGIKIKKDKEDSERYIKYETLFNSSVTLDEHWDASDMANETNRPTSTTHIVYTLLKELWQIPGKYKKQMQKFVDFVDIVDSKYYSIAWSDFDNLHRTILWLHRNLPIEYVYNYFKNTENTGFEILDQEYLCNRNNDVMIEKGKKESLKNISDQKKDSLERAKIKYNIADIKCQYLSYGKFSFIIDIWSKINYCPQVSEYNGRWCFRLFPNGDVYIYSPEGLPESIGKYKTNSPFLIKNMNRTEFFKLLKEFDFNDRIEGKEWIMNSIDIIYSNIESKIRAKEWKLKQKEQEELNFNKKVSDLSKIKNLKVWEKYKWIIDWVRNNMFYVWIDSDNKWVVHQNQVWKELFKEKFKWNNKPKRGDEITVELIDLSQWNQKLQFSVS